MIVDDLRGDSLVSVAKVVTWLGSLTVATTLIALAASVLVTRRRIAEAGILVVGLALTFALVHILKGSVDRPRPVNPLVGTDGHSFPSGHAAYSVAYVAIAVALARSVSWLTGRVAVVLIAVALAAVVGITRIYLRAHFLSDVLGGWGLGAAVFAVCGLVALVMVHLRENGAPP
jgi:undecaprenyl-diphosphatase